MQHTEHHFTSTEVVRDIVIGMSDGLTVPFALAAGLSGTVQSTHIVVIAGLAEIAAGSIAMGLGGYLAAKTELEHYRSEERREYIETQEKTEREKEEVAEIFHGYGLSVAQAAPIVEAISAAVPSSGKRLTAMRSATCSRPRSCTMRLNGWRRGTSVSR